MATEPGAQAAAIGLLTSRADRERVIELLKAAFVQGRLAKDEFDARVGQALTSRTYAELAAAGADIPSGLTGVPAGLTPAGLTGVPAGLTGTMPPHPPARGLRRVPMNAAITGGALVMLGANAGMLAAFMSGSKVAMVLMGVFTVVATILAIVTMIVAR